MLINIYLIGKTNFLLGSSCKISRDSFFRYITENIISLMSQEIVFDNILIDIFKVSNEKFILDYVK
jgi:hypothetical protein